MHKSQLTCPSHLPHLPTIMCPKLQSEGGSRNVLQGGWGQRGGVHNALMLWAWVSNSGEGRGVKPEPLYTATLISHIFVAPAQHTSPPLML